MLCVKPTNDTELKNMILSSDNIKGISPEVLTAVENGKVIGYIAVDPVDRCLMILSIRIDSCKDFSSMTANDREIAEYLIRAAGNYAYNRLIQNLVCNNSDYKSLLEPFGFKEIDNKLQLDIKLLFKKCENCLSGH